MKLTAYDKPIPAREFKGYYQGVSGVAKHPDYLADLDSDMPAKRIAALWNVSPNTVYTHRWKRREGEL